MSADKQVPEFIPRSRVTEFLRDVGFDPSDVKEMHFDPYCVEVVVHARVVNGMTLPKDRERLTTCAITIPVRETVEDRE